MGMRFLLFLLAGTFLMSSNLMARADRSCLYERYEDELTLMEEEDSKRSIRRKLMRLAKVRAPYKGLKYSLTKDGLLIFNNTGDDDPHHGLMLGSCEGDGAGFARIWLSRDKKRILRIYLDRYSLAECSRKETVKKVKKILKEALEDDDGLDDNEDEDDIFVLDPKIKHPDC